jgi:hypothetical protein
MPEHAPKNDNAARDRAIKKALDCIRLARNNPNVNEAVLARSMARQIAIRYRLDLDALEQHDKARKPDTHHTQKPRPRPDFDFWREVFSIVTGEEFTPEEFDRALKTFFQKAAKFAAVVREK